VPCGEERVAKRAAAGEGPLSGCGEAGEGRRQATFCCVSRLPHGRCWRKAGEGVVRRLSLRSLRTSAPSEPLRVRGCWLS
jgi:hypothetical protein